MEDADASRNESERAVNHRVSASFAHSVCEGSVAEVDGVVYLAWNRGKKVTVIPLQCTRNLK